MVRSGHVAIQVGLLTFAVAVARSIVATAGHPTVVLDIGVVVLAAVLLRACTVRAELGPSSVLVVNLFRTTEVAVSDIVCLEGSRTFLPSPDGLWGGALGIRLASGTVLTVQAGHLAAIGGRAWRLGPSSRRRWASIQSWCGEVNVPLSVSAAELVLPGAAGRSLELRDDTD